MPYLLQDLVVDRVDLVDEGANSAAFIEVFKRRESRTPMEFTEILSKLKPEHAAVIQQELDNAQQELAKARNDIETISAERDSAIAERDEAAKKAAEEPEKPEAEKPEAEKPEAEKPEAEKPEAEKPEAEESEEPEVDESAEKGLGFDETEVLKAMPESIRTEYLKMRAQKEAAEEQVRKNAEEKLEAEAVTKAAALKALPVDQGTLVEILKKCDPTVVDVLSAAAAAIENTVLEEVGKAGQSSQAHSADAWDQIEAEAEKIMERDSVTKQRAIATVIKEKPDLYEKYLNGGAN